LQSETWRYELAVKFYFIAAVRALITYAAAVWRPLYSPGGSSPFSADVWDIWPLPVFTRDSTY